MRMRQVQEKGIKYTCTGELEGCNGRFFATMRWLQAKFLCVSADASELGRGFGFRPIIINGISERPRFGVRRQS